MGALLIFSFSHFLILSCEGIDCTLDNVVAMKIGFYNSESKVAVSITDAVDVTAEGTDSLLLNQERNVQTLSLPMSYWQEADTLRLQFSGSDEEGNSYAYHIVLRINKTNLPHFESPDCPTVMFHEISSINYDDPYQLADSIVVDNPTVNYASLENVKIYLRGSAD